MSDTPGTPDPAWEGSDLISVGESGYTVWDYVDAVNGKGDFGSLGYDWTDKPHRLVYDLANEIMRRAALQEEVLDDVKALRVELDAVGDALATMQADVNDALASLPPEGRHLAAVPDDPRLRVDAIAGMDVAVTVLDEDDEHVEGSEFGLADDPIPLPTEASPSLRLVPSEEDS